MQTEPFSRIHKQQLTRQLAAAAAVQVVDILVQSKAAGN